MLEIENLQTEVDGKSVLKGLNLKVKAGEVHAIMGPNGSGKSTLSKVISGHPLCRVTDGSVRFEINFEMRNLLALEADQRAKEGVFLAFQYPTEVPGVSNLTFLKTSFQSTCRHHGIAEMGDSEFLKLVKEKAKLVEFDLDFLDRAVNEGFSGGEKKRNEILQMAVLNPRLMILDEIDSGLDIDSLRIVSNAVNRLRSKENALILITHYQRLLDYIQPDFVHVLREGRIAVSGDRSLAFKLEKEGYDWIQ